MKAFKGIALIILFVFAGMNMHAQQDQDKTSIKISTSDLKQAEKLTDIFPEKNIKGTIHSYTVSIKKGGDIQIIQNDGNYFSEELKKEFAATSKDDHIWVDDIKITRIQKITVGASLLVVE